MESKLYEWIIDQLSLDELRNACKKLNIKIPGFINIQNYPKFLMIKALVKEKNRLLEYIKDYSEDLEEKNELLNKSIDEIKEIVNNSEGKKRFNQIIYLFTREKTEYIDIVCSIIFPDNNDDMLDMKEQKVIGNIDNDEEVKVMLNQEDEVSKYIVTVEQKNDFYNIYPLYKIDNKIIEEVDGDCFPDYGNINVNPWYEFSAKNYDLQPFWICEFRKSDLEETKNKTKYKINGDKLISNNNIYDINNEGIYEIAEVIEDYNEIEDILYKDKIKIRNKPIKGKLYIKSDKYIYGPFSYLENSMGGGYYINKKENDYIVGRYSIEENINNLCLIEINNPYKYSNSYIKAVYFYDKKNLICTEIDTISEEGLIEKLSRTISNQKSNYSKDEIKDIRTNINVLVNNSMSKEREDRIKQMIMNTQKTEEFIENDLIKLISSLLENEETKNSIAEKILKENDILRKLQNVEYTSSKLEAIKKECEKYENYLKEMQNQKEDMNSKKEQELIEKMNYDISELKNRKEEMEKDIDEISIKYNLCMEISELETRKNYLNEQAQKAQNEYDVFKSHSEKAEKDIRTKLGSITNEYSDIAFDGIIANEILESAANWNKNRNKESYEKLIASKDNISKTKTLNIKSFDASECVEYIYNRFKEFRNYSKNDIINMMICINQNFLTVFAGQPGVGKTSVCNIIASILGLYNQDENYNRFVEVSVEKGWTSKRDLIGYYNPLTKSFDKNNGLLYQTFNILNIEDMKGVYDFPYYILLDEANLSSMEYYWADFMNVCDFDKKDRKINLGEEYIYSIPKTLRFLATINYDHTTETLSPRLIDRAWVILLDIDTTKSVLNYEDKEILPGKDIVEFKTLSDTFIYYYEKEDELPQQILDSLKSIYSKFKDNNIIVSPRINNMIVKYLKVGCRLLEETEDTGSSDYVALDYAVSQKLLPKINGYGENYKKFLKDILNLFDDKNMIKCKKIIEDIIRKGDNNMEYYQFFS